MVGINDRGIEIELEIITESKDIRTAQRLSKMLADKRVTI
jgi:hypothetical protein